MLESEELLLESLKKVRARPAKRTKEVTSEMPALEGRAAKLRAEIANLVDVLSVTPKAETGHLLTAMHERHEELTTLDARINATKVAPDVILLEVRRMEEEAKKLIADLRAAACDAQHDPWCVERPQTHCVFEPEPCDPDVFNPCPDPRHVMCEGSAEAGAFYLVYDPERWRWRCGR